MMSLEKMKHEKGVSAMDIAKSLLDYGIHPPTMYFPLIVHEALMIEPTETESKETLDEAIAVFREIYERAVKDPQDVQNSPKKTPIGRPDEVQAARKPVLRRYQQTVAQTKPYGKTKQAGKARLLYPDKFVLRFVGSLPTTLHKLLTLIRRS